MGEDYQLAAHACGTECHSGQDGRERTEQAGLVHPPGSRSASRHLVPGYGPCTRSELEHLEKLTKYNVLVMLFTDCIDQRNYADVVAVLPHWFYLQNIRFKKTIPNFYLVATKLIQCPAALDETRVECRVLAQIARANES